MPIFLNLPIKKKIIVCAPLLEKIDVRKYLNISILSVTVSGESGKNARVCYYDWFLDIRDQCINHNIEFYFKQTGSNFKKDGKTYMVLRKFQNSQALKANINYKV